jgi:hypothetical protein
MARRISPDIIVKDGGGFSRMRFRELWKWTKGEENFYSKLCIGRVLHVCSGKSSFGDVRVDRYEKCDVRADYRYLPFKDNSFDTVICDPVWGKSERLDSGIMQWLSELRRVARKRIVIVHNTIFSIRGCVLVNVYAVKVRGLLWKVVQVHDKLLTLDLAVTKIAGEFSNTQGITRRRGRPKLVELVDFERVKADYERLKSLRKTAKLHKISYVSVSRIVKDGKSLGKA